MRAILSTITNLISTGRTANSNACVNCGAPLWTGSGDYCSAACEQADKG
jgi:uncharacterized Zn finger protein (UPF0148 family)